MAKKVLFPDSFLIKVFTFSVGTFKIVRRRDKSAQGVRTLLYNQSLQHKRLKFFYADFCRLGGCRLNKAMRPIGRAVWLYNVFENLDSFTSKNSWSSTIIVQALNIAPAGWKVEKTSHLNMMSDNTGNKIEWFPENDRQLRIIFRLGGGAAHQQNLCMSLINDVFLPLRSVIGMLYFSSGGIYYYLGDNYCSENKRGYEKCMSYLNVSNIIWQCANCAKSSVGCVLNVLFYH